MIPEIRKILFVTDLSDSARYAFKYAADIAASYGADIVVIFVIADMPSNTESNIAGLIGEKEWEELKKKNEQDVKNILIGKKTESKLIKQALERFCVKSRDDSPMAEGQVEIFVKSGNVAEEIIGQSESSDCDIIVMAYHSRNMLAEAIIGGVTRKVLRRSKKPVLLVPMPEEKG